MADSYVPIFFDWMEVTGELNAQEKGRLIDAIVCYARGDGDWQDQIKGNERYLFPAFKRQIDRAAELSDIRSKAGASKAKQSEANGSKAEQTEANASKAEQKSAKPSKINKEEEYKEEYKEEYEYKDDNNNGGGNARAREDAATDEVMAFATGNLQYMGPRALEELQTFRDELPDDVILYGLNCACDNGKRTWAYARSILNRYVSVGFKSVGDIKSAEAKREAQKASMISDGHGGKVVNPALNFQQRSDIEFSAEIDNSWMSEFLPGGAASAK